MGCNEEFKQLVNILEQELDMSVQLKNLFEEKKEILKHSKTDELGIIDNKIIAQSNLISELEKSRKKISNILLGQDGCMSDYVKFSEENEPAYTDKLKDLNVKICNNSEQLVLLNHQNVELMNHGIIMTNKMLETIVNAFVPQGSNYNESGKTDSHDLDMWTVNEEI